MTFVQETCLNLDNVCLTFTIHYEGRKAGTTPPGGYSIIIRGEEVIKSFDSEEWFSIRRFGDCELDIGTCIGFVLLACMSRLLTFPFSSIRF